MADRVINVTVKFSTKELEVLCSLASDQLFRREFIDPRLPGYQTNASELGMGKKLLERLRLVTDRANGVPVMKRAGALL
jgi:hypothetical protein